MFTDLKPYPECQGTASDDLGPLPVHWTTRRLGQIGAFIKGRGGSREDDVDSGVSCVRYGDIYKYHSAFIRRAHSFVTDEKSVHYTRLQRGDLLFALSGESLEEIGKSAENLLDDPAVCAGDLGVLRVRGGIAPGFLGYVVDARYAAVQKTRMGRGDIIVHISVGELKRLLVALPPAAEQAAIVNYLGHANARIDRAIAAKGKLIALLEEQKQAIISQAVTRGLDHGAPVVDSGIPWVGAVPRHWRLQRVKHFFIDVDVRSVTGTEELLSVSHLTGVSPRRLKSVSMFKAASYVGHKTCEPGDLVVNTMWAWMGALGVAAEAGIVSPAYNVYRSLRADVDPEFASLLFRTPSYVAYFRSQSTGVQPSRLRFYPDQLGATPIALPPVGEQLEIVREAAARTADADSAIASAHREVALLREFRTRLIADVVTGQLDVRAVAAGLPDLDPSDLAGDVGADVEDDLDTEAAEFLEDVDA